MIIAGTVSYHALSEHDLGVGPNSTTTHYNELKVTDVIGNIIYETKSAEPKTELHLENSGVYFITVISGKETSIKKLVITN